MKVYTTFDFGTVTAVVPLVVVGAAVVAENIMETLLGPGAYGKYNQQAKVENRSIGEKR